MSKKINRNDIDLDNLDYTEALEEEAMMAKKTKKTKKNKKDKEEIVMINEETIVTVEEETTTIEEVSTTTTDENKEEETMTEEKKTRKNHNRIINKVILAKDANGIYDWRYINIDSHGVSMASDKEDYTPNTEFTVDWTVDSDMIPAFLQINKSNLNEYMRGKAASTRFYICKNNVPEAIYGPDGKVKIAVFASQGGVKKGERYFCDEEFVEKYKNEGSMVEYSSDPMMKKYLELRRAISLLQFKKAPMYLNAINDKSLDREIAKISKEITALTRELDKVISVMNKGLLKPDFGVAQANQVTAFFWTPCKKKGVPMKVKIMDEVPVKVGCDGYVDTRKEESWDVQDKMNGEDPYMKISIDDGSAFVDKEYAEAHGFFGEGIEDMTQARSGMGYKNGVMTEIALDFKGTVQLVNMPSGMKDAIYVSKSCAKAIKRFSKEKIESCEYQFYTMDKNIHKNGRIEIGPQVMMYILTRATRKEMEELAKYQVEQLNVLKDEKGYKKLVAEMTKKTCSVRMGESIIEKVTSIVEHKAFEGLVYSSMFINSAAKEACSMYNTLRGCTISVEGASAKAQGDIEAILEVYKAQMEGKTIDVKEVAHIPAGQVIVPMEWKKKWGLKKGQKLFVYRNPYNSTTACVVTIFGFSKVRDTLQFSALDNNSHKLASDNDGDTIYASWNEIIIQIAEKANKFAVECGAKVLAYRTGEEDVKDRGIPADRYLAFAPANGNVGTVCEPLFGLISLIPNGCTDPDESIYCGNDVETEEEIYTTPREIYQLLDHGFVGTTYAIDSAKKHYVNMYAKTSQTLRIAKIINGGTYFTKIYYHAVRATYEVEEGEGFYCIDGKPVTLIGENGGVAVFSQVAADMIQPGLGFMADHRDILCGYTYGSIECGTVTTNGFVYCPNVTFDGISSDVFFKKTRFEAANTDITEYRGMYVNVEELSAFGCDCDGVQLYGEDFKSWLIMHLTERTREMSGEEIYTSVSLDTKYGNYLSIGLLAKRLERAFANFTAFDGYYDGKGKVRKTREKVHAHMEKLIKNWVSAFCDEAADLEATDIEATDLLYDEVAAFLFGQYADEKYGSDVQTFLSNEKFRNRLFAQEKIWLQNKIEAGEIEFESLTPFEKDLYNGNVIMRSDEEIDAENEDK